MTLFLVAGYGWLSDESTGELRWLLGDIRWANHLVLLLVEGKDAVWFIR